jgi:UDP-N-acetylglucosamine pyrophosphorylase
LDLVRLKTSVCDKGTLPPAGKQGTILLCHGIEAFQVEFPDIQDFFQIKAQDLEKA